MNLTMKHEHGGSRENAGRKSAFPGAHVKVPMDFTPVGLQLLARLQRRSGLSRNNILTQLARLHAADLHFDAVDGPVYPGKAQNVLAIRMPGREARLLERARARTGKGFSDLGEALVRTYGPTATFPELPRRRDSIRRRRRSRPRRRRR
jgi:hypothetical protein